MAPRARAEEAESEAAEPHRDAEEIASILDGAVKSLTEGTHSKTFVNLARLKRRSRMMEPSEIQANLLRYIITHDGMGFGEALGCDWRFLGGLFTRGLVTWEARGGDWRLVVTPEGARGGARAGRSRH